MHDVCDRDSTFQPIPFAQRRRLRRCPDSVCDTLAGQGTVQMQPSARPDYHHTCKPRSNFSSARAYHPHGCSACPSAAQQVCRLFPKGPTATPAGGTLSFESTIPTLRRFRRCLTLAQTVPVCLCCLTLKPPYIYNRISTRVHPSVPLKFFPPGPALPSGRPPHTACVPSNHV